MSSLDTTGRSFPIGASIRRGGVNFSLYSRGATGVELLLFDKADDGQPTRSIRFDPASNRTYHYWHVFVPNVRPGQIYGYRVDGPFEPSMGMRFDPAKVLLDPYGRAVAVPSGYRRDAARERGDNVATAMKSVVVDTGAYDWEGDKPLHTPSSRTIIYELHVRGFTRHPSSCVTESKRGTFAGLIEKIPYLQQLGITAVELMPVFQFDAQDCPPGRVNYWGYSPISFFAPHHAYSGCQDPLGAIDEFRDMVKWDIESDPQLAGTKLFAEAWDVTCDDGFTLNDLVSFDCKHNEANGEGNRDGADDNRSWNCGVEGPTDDPAVERLRNRQVKNFLAVTMLSIGMPMILMGDEVRRTQHGNNNAYCQDNAISWFDWTLAVPHSDVHRFLTLLAASVALRDVEHERLRVPLNRLLQQANIAWRGVELGQPDWRACSHSLALTAEVPRAGLVVHLILNAYWEPLEFELPSCGGPGAGPWLRWIDTSLDPPNDIAPWQTAPPVPAGCYRASERSVVVLAHWLEPHQTWRQ